MRRHSHMRSVRRDLLGICDLPRRDNVHGRSNLRRQSDLRRNSYVRRVDDMLWHGHVSR